jgi:hypothetical protein
VGPVGAGGRRGQATAAAVLTVALAAKTVATVEAGGLVVVGTWQVALVGSGARCTGRRASRRRRRTKCMGAAPANAVRLGAVAGGGVTTSATHVLRTCSASAQVEGSTTKHHGLPSPESWQPHALATSTPPLMQVVASDVQRHPAPSGTG